MGRIAGIAPVATKKFEINTFLGADLTNQASYMSPSRSPDCVNMIRKSSGKVQKWIGYHTVKKYPDRINGVHIFTDETGENTLYHSGTRLYMGDEVLYEGMADERSVSKQFDGKLFILDGLKMLVCFKENEQDNKEDTAKQSALQGEKQSGEKNKFVCKTAESIAYVPTIFISKPPKGGGEPYEPINLLQDKKTESFLGTPADKVYQLATTEIDSVEEIVKVTANGKITLKETVDYTVDKALGKVNFTAVHSPVVAGEDNIKITYKKVVEAYSDRINKCDIAALYGLNGARDRLFCAGYKKFCNRDYYSQLNNGLYFGDVWYMVIGADNSKIMGYSIVNDKLATHLDRSDDDTNIVLRTGDLLEGEAAFKLQGGFQGSGAISKYAFGVLETEPLFLTRNGIYAVTPSDILGERFAQLRSYYLNGLLLKQDLANAVSATFENFYMLCVGEYIFALDSTQSSKENSEPYSNRQYSAFYRNNVNARCIWTQGKHLCFGDEQGNVKQFYTDYDDIVSFNDDGKPIDAKWTTPEFFGSDFYTKKNFKKAHLLLASAPATSVKISARYDGITETVKDYDAQARYFTYSRLTYSKFTYKTDKTSQGITEKFSIKPENKKIQFIFENEDKNEPFGLYQAVIEFKER